MKYLPSRCFLTSITLCMAIASVDAFAFGDEGHEIVAIIAYERLTPRVRIKVDELLNADADTLTAPDFASRATWADKYRDSDRNGTKAHYNATHNWHFVDIEIDDPNLDVACNNYPALQEGIFASAGTPDDCVVDKIKQFSAELKNPAIDKSEKIVALKFIMHFIGDLHQPLHAADNHDQGGNADTIQYIKKKTKRTNTGNLHSYWDTELVEELGLNPNAVAKTLSGEITAAEANEWSSGNIAEWVMQSFTIAKEVAYNVNDLKKFTDNKGKTVIIIDDQYNKKAYLATKSQLQKAGVRLAYVLNEALQ